MTEVRFVSRPTTGAVARFAVAFFSRSAFAQGVHGFGWGNALLGLLVGMPAEIWLPPTIIGIVIGTGSIAIPVYWWMLKRDPDRLMETVRADSTGIVIEAPGSETRQAWSFYHEARETGQIVSLAGNRSMTQILSLEGVPEAEAQAFRGFLRAAGLLRTGGAWARGVLGFVAGLLVALAFPFVIGAVRFE